VVDALRWLFDEIRKTTKARFAVSDEIREMNLGP
jgi:hypothetical protein